MHTEDLAHLLASASGELHDAEQEQPTVDAVLGAAVEMVPSATHASITVRRVRRSFVTLGASSDVSREADQLQYGLKEGPCVEAAEGASWLRSGDIGRDARWPRWGPQARRLGLVSLLSIGLTARGEHIGALNLYAQDEGQFSDRDEVEMAVLFAVHAAQALSSARLVTGLEVALSTRHHIGVAQGIIMERYGLSLEQSFSLLCRISAQTETKVAVLARQIVETSEVPTVAQQ